MLEDIFVAPFYTFGIAIWNLMLSLIGISGVQTPWSFSNGAWTYTTETIYPWFSAVGATLLNIFFYIGIVRQSSNLRQNMTLEIVVETCIKAVLANSFLLIGISLMRWFFSLSSEFSAEIFGSADISFIQADMDVGATILYMTFGIIFFVVSLVCSVTIFLVVYGRFLMLYQIIAAYPLAVSTLPGGPGINQTFFAWMRTFFSKVFGIIFIALAIAIASSMCNSLPFDSLKGTAAGMVDGMLQAIQNIFIMVLLTASVKGTDSFMKQVFAL